MNVDPDNPKWPGRDRLVLSKGHAAPALYMALAGKGFFPKAWLKTLNMNGTKLPSHADARTVPGIDATTGSLGQGLSVACGMSFAAKINKHDHNVFCIMGDGESNEGQNWEAGMFAAHNKLDNLVAITDYNKLQIDGATDEILSLEPLHDKWKAFGWEVFEMNGHDWDDVYTTLKAAKEVKGKPAMVIAHTIKAKGCSVLEGEAGSHNIKVPDQEAYKKFMNALEAKDVELPY
jgi:transketolase